jgi:uncharacterized protein YndB with AHSA1/START domain
MLKKAAIGLGAVVAGILVFAATRPDSFRVERSIQIAAPPESIYPLLSDFREWKRWSPWEELDPDMQRTFSGADEGNGAVYAWDGNRKAGEGRMEIIQAVPEEHLSIALTFIRPFESHNTAEFTLVPNPEGTEVRWTMHGPAPYVTRLMTVFLSMDRLIGPDFERGLAELKRTTEGWMP